MPADPFAPSKVGRRNSKTHARVVKEVAMTGSDGEAGDGVSQLVRGSCSHT